MPTLEDAHRLTRRLDDYRAQLTSNDEAILDGLLIMSGGGPPHTPHATKQDYDHLIAKLEALKATLSNGEQKALEGLLLSARLAAIEALD